MATGTIVKAWRTGQTAYAAVSVDGIEYIADAQLLDAQGQAKSGAVLKAELTAAVKAKRDAQLAAASPLSVTGTVTV